MGNLYTKSQPGPVTEEDYRHWSPESQAYASADILQQLLRLGWALGKVAAVESHFFGAYRHVDVYYFTLIDSEERIELPVLSSPHVLRLISEHGLTVLRIGKPHQMQL